jgi:hypothetical protein
MKENYPYRFKTEQEFIKQFGTDWRRRVNFNWDGEMDYLCGKVFPFMNNWGAYDCWIINNKMLTENKSKVPNYNPKKIIIEI